MACQSSVKTLSHKRSKSVSLKGSRALATNKQNQEKRFPRTKNNPDLVTASSLNAKKELNNIIIKRDPSDLKALSFNLTDKEKIFFELSGEKVNQLSEIETYKKIVEKYQSSDSIALKAYVNLLLKKFPRSIYCDNALYLEGMMYFSEKKYGESLHSFQKILTNYPQSNKAVSALFAKGVVFKKMNLHKEAISLLAKVINNYPGSPESIRAEMEMKLMTQN